MAAVAVASSTKYPSVPLIEQIKGNPKIINRFKTELQGYHCVNTSPLKESRWEDVNESILTPYFAITDVAKGDHRSGKDMVCNGVGLSNKSSICDKKGMVNISSYRLGGVCSDKDPGDIAKIKSEMSKRDTHFIVDQR